MAEEHSNTNPEKLINFQLTPASPCDLEFNPKGTEKGFKLKVRNAETQAAGYLFLKSSAKMNFHCFKLIVGKIISRIFELDVNDATHNDDIVTILHLEGSNSLTFKLGSDSHTEYNVGLSDMDKEIEKVPNITSFGEAVSTSKKIRDMIHRLNGETSETGGNNNNNNDGGANNALVNRLRADLFKIEEYDAQNRLARVWDTSISPDEYNSWQTFAAAVFRFWWLHVCGIDNAHRIVNVTDWNPSHCWPGGETEFGHAVDWHFTNLNWPHHPWENVRQWINCLKVSLRQYGVQRNANDNNACVNYWGRVVVFKIEEYDAQNMLARDWYTLIVPDEYNSWYSFGAAVFRYWWENVSGIGNSIGMIVDAAEMNPSCCWPRGETEFGQLALWFTNLNWPEHAWDTVRQKINCLRVSPRQYGERNYANNAQISLYSALYSFPEEIRGLRTQPPSPNRDFSLICHEISAGLNSSADSPDQFGICSDLITQPPSATTMQDSANSSPQSDPEMLFDEKKWKKNKLRKMYRKRAYERRQAEEVGKQEQEEVRKQEQEEVRKQDEEEREEEDREQETEEHEVEEDQEQEKEEKKEEEDREQEREDATWRRRIFITVLLLLGVMLLLMIKNALQ